ncbi:MAG: hypothetical protein Q9187_004124, partial [Circinaria calcarea]
DIAGLLKDQEFIRVDNRNSGSIQTFVTQRTEEWFSQYNFLPEAQAEIRGFLAPLASNAKGMFLYAEVVLSSMDYLDDIEKIREDFSVLPKSLDDAILNRINQLRPSEKDRVRKILGWVGCAPMPLTRQEIEQALVVSGEGNKENTKVIAVLDIPRICGPIIERVDDYIQFVHFTVKEYFFSSSITGSLSVAEAKLGLAVCCVTYLCQMHHDPDLLDEEIDGNILSGAYRLHDLAATTWFELVELSVPLLKQETTLSPKFIDALETLRCGRTSGTYDKGAETFTASSLEPFKSISPTLHDMLREVAYFRRASLKSNFDEDNDSSWTSLDPLTISATSVRIHQRLRNLLCRNNKHQDCQCEIIRWHYGQRPFKCGFLNCSFRRHGFESRPLQKSHMKHHDRPWNCHFEDCEYTEGGFLSRKMRDDHYRDHITTNPQGTAYSENVEADEIQPLLFDLIKADKVDAVRNLMDQFKALPAEIQEALQECAASVGSAAMIDLIQPFDKSFPIDLLKISIRAANVDLFKHLLSRSKKCEFVDNNGGKYDHDPKYWTVFKEVLESDSEEIFEEWVKYANVETKESEQRGSLPFRAQYIKPSIFRATAGHPSRENLLITTWEELGVSELLGRPTLGRALADVVSTTYSVKLAKYLIDHKAKVDFRRSDLYLTPLHYAARQNSAAAAEMMRYLLLQGANPELKGGRARLRICEEKGAKGIAKWLGMSWDELVAKTKEEREKIA